MRDYWNSRARENAVWYVDTSLDYDGPDLERFYETGRRVVEDALDNGPVRPDGRQLAVEIGPGLGRIAKALSEHFDEVVGVDVSEEMVNRARELIREPRVRFEVGNGRDLSQISSGSADFVVTFTVLQHLPSAEIIEGYLREAARILRPGGVLCAQWNNLPHARRWRLKVRWWQLRRRILGALGRSVEIRTAPEFAGTRLPFDRVSRVLEQSSMVVKGTKDLGKLFAWVWAQKEAG